MANYKSRTFQVLAALSLTAACQGDGLRDEVPELVQVTQALVTGFGAGSLDPSFGSGGKVLTDVPAGLDERAEDALLTVENGRIVVGGSQNGDLLLVGYNSDGSLDTSFGVGGFSRLGTANPLSNDFIRGLAQQSDGKIVAAGYSQVSDLSGLVTSVIVARFLPDGQPDATFGVGGVVVTTDAGLDSLGQELIVQSDGKIVVAGLGRPAPVAPNQFLVQRYLANGTLDASFGTGGAVLTQFASPGWDAEAVDLAIQFDEKIVVAGYNEDNGGGGGANGRYAVARYLPNGALDPSFDGDGKVLITLGVSGLNECHAVTLQPDGKVVLAGVAGISPFQVVIARLNSNGSLDSSFGTGGITRSNLGGDAQAFDVVLQTDLKPLVSGRLTIAGVEHFLVARYTTAGVLDSSFGSGGKVTTDFVQDSVANTLLLEPLAGQVIAAGRGIDYSADPDHGGGKFALARYRLGGSIVVGNFDGSTEGFTYVDDTFRGTSRPTYASGTALASGGFTGGALRVRVGNVDENDITNGMSGGWRRTFTLTETARVRVTFRYNLTQPPNLEPDEYGLVMFAADGVTMGKDDSDSVADLSGVEGGEGGPDLTTGWGQTSFNLGHLSPGTHTVTFGGFQNKKTATDEYSDILIDDVLVSTLPATTDTVISENFFNGPGNFTYQDDAFGTSQPTYASGAFTPTGGNTDGGVSVTLGNVNGSDISNISGSLAADHHPACPDQDRAPCASSSGTFSPRCTSPTSGPSRSGPSIPPRSPPPACGSPATATAVGPRTAAGWSCRWPPARWPRGPTSSSWGCSTTARRRSTSPPPSRSTTCR